MFVRTVNEENNEVECTNRNIGFTLMCLCAYTFSKVCSLVL